MNTLALRYDRNVRLFGPEGQGKLQRTSAFVAGVGGLGSPLVQHLALLGVGKITLVEPEELDETNRNRFVGARFEDPVPGSPKARLSARLVREINPEIAVTEIPLPLVSREAFDAVKAADWVFGCFDEDGPRFILNELCAAYSKPYVDLASDVPESDKYGGRVCTAWRGRGCLNCLGLLDHGDVHRYLSSYAELEKRRAIYGIDREVLGEIGPSVSPINGVIAGLAATEFMAAATGMRDPARFVEYRGWISKVVVNTDPPKTSCYYCQGIFGKDKDADVERYLKIPHLQNRVLSDA